MKDSSGRKMGVLVWNLLLLSFFMFIPVSYAAEACTFGALKQVDVSSIDDFVAAEKIRLGQRMEGDVPLRVSRSGDAADLEKVYQRINIHFPEAKRAVPVQQHKEALAVKLRVTAQEPSLDSLVNKEITSLADKYGEEETIVSLMDLFYLDKEMKGRNYFSPDKVKKAVGQLAMSQSEKERIIQLMTRLGDEIKKQSSEFHIENMLDLEKLKAVHQDVLSHILSEEGISSSELLDMMGTVLVRQKGQGSVSAVSEANIETLLEFDRHLDRLIKSSELDSNARVIGLLGDIEPAVSVRMARHGPESVDIAYVSRKSMMTEGEKLVYFGELSTNPALILDESLLDQGLVYSSIYKKYPDGTETGIFVDSWDMIKELELKGEEARLRFRREFRKKLEIVLESDSEFAREAERIYSQLHLGAEDVIFTDTGFKGTIPTFLATMHEIKHPGQKAEIFLYGVKDEYAGVISHFVVGRRNVKKIENMGKFSEIGGFSLTKGALVGRSSPKDELLASIDQFFIGRTAGTPSPGDPRLYDAPSVPVTRSRDVPQKLTRIADRNDIDDSVRNVLDDLDVEAMGDADVLAPSIGKIGEPGSAVNQLGLDRPKLVHKKDGRKVTWEIDTSNPTTAKIRAKGQLGAEDSGRKQMAMAGIMDESDDVLVPAVRRKKFSDGTGYVEKEVIEGARDLGVTPLEMRNNLKNLQDAGKITAQEAEQLGNMLRKQGVRNNLLGFTNQGTKFKRMPDGSLKLVVEPNPDTMKGMLDYEVLHEIGDSHLSSTTDSVYGFFNKADYYNDGLFDAERFRAHVTEAVDEVADMIGDKGAFMKKYTDAGYTHDEAQKMFKRIENRVANARREIEAGVPGDLRTMIDNGGRLLAQSDGTYTALKARKKVGPRVKVFSDPLKRGNMRPDADTVADFVPKHTPAKERFKTFDELTVSPPRAPESVIQHNNELFGHVARDPDVRRALDKVHVSGGKKCPILGFAARTRKGGGCVPEFEVDSAEELASVERLNDALDSAGAEQVQVVKTGFIDESPPHALERAGKQQVQMIAEFGGREVQLQSIGKFTPDEITPEALTRVANVFFDDSAKMARTGKLTPRMQALVDEGVITAQKAVVLKHAAVGVEEGVRFGGSHVSIIEKWGTYMIQRVRATYHLTNKAKRKLIEAIQREVNRAKNTLGREGKMDKLAQDDGGRNVRGFGGKSGFSRTDFPIKLGPGAARKGEKHINKVYNLVEEGKFDDAFAKLLTDKDSFLPQDIDALTKFVIERKHAFDEILERASLVFGTRLDPTKNEHLRSKAVETVKKLKPSHMRSSETTGTILRDGKILSSKRQGRTNRYYAEKGLENKVFFSLGGPFEAIGKDGPVFVARKDVLKARDFEANPFDSIVYDDVVEVKSNTITDEALLRSYYTTFVQNEGKIIPVKKIGGRRASAIPEIRFESEIDLNEIEAILVSPEDYKVFTTDPLIPAQTKAKLVNINDLGVGSTTEGYYNYVGLENAIDIPLDMIP